MQWNWERHPIHVFPEVKNSKLNKYLKNPLISVKALGNPSLKRFTIYLKSVNFLIIAKFQYDLDAEGSIYMAQINAIRV
jgi:hypothetical protein